MPVLGGAMGGVCAATGRAIIGIEHVIRAINRFIGVLPNGGDRTVNAARPAPGALPGPPRLEEPLDLPCLVLRLVDQPVGLDPRHHRAQLPDEVLGGPLPEDRELLYPWIGVEWVEDNFQERVNQDQILRTEDVLVGLRAYARVGYASESAGSDRDALIASAYLKNGVDLHSGQSVFGSLSASGRIEDGSLQNGIVGAEGRLYWPTSQYSKFYAAVAGAVTENLDEEAQLLLGGDNGLRGYPLRYQAGTARALLTLEQRYYTKWYPFRLFHVGAAAFFDMGRTWGTDVTGQQSDGLLKDVGIGLRLGSSRSSFGNVIHIDLAFPLDGGDDIDSVQLLVQTKASF